MINTIDDLDKLDGVEVRLAKDVTQFIALIKESRTNRSSIFNIAIPINSLSEYIEYVEIQQQQSERNTHPLVFRGHSDINYRLIPSIMRDDVFPNGVPDAHAVQEYEHRIMHEFKNRARPHVNILPREIVRYWEWLARAQHHFLPTRLLDWTERAATALYFSVYKKNESLSCVWAITAPDEIDVLFHKDAEQLDTVKLYRPPHIVPRIAMQQGCFTVHPNDYLARDRIWILGPRIIHVINEKSKNRLLDGLNAVGINEASMFPGLDGIARHIKSTMKP